MREWHPQPKPPRHKCLLGKSIDSRSAAEQVLKLSPFAPVASSASLACRED